MEKLLILGIDGADHKLTKRLIKQGKLPNLKRLSSNGVFTPLQSTNPPLTPQAWSSFVSGVNPGKHGVFDFSFIPKDSYHARLTNSLDRKTLAFWDYFEEEGFSCGVMNVPLTWPAQKLQRGYLISGMHTPELKQLSLDQNVLEFLQADGDYVIDVMSWWYQNLDEFLFQLKNMVNQRLKLFQKMRFEYPVDVSCCVFVGLDRVSHALWSMQDFVVGEQGWKYQTAVTDIYKQIDRCVGEILDTIAEDTHVMVLSDHGFGDLKKDVYLNNWLHKKGFLSFDSQRLSLESLSHPSWPSNYLSSSLFKGLSKFDFFQQQIDPRQKPFEALDMDFLEMFLYIDRSAF